MLDASSSACSLYMKRKPCNQKVTNRCEAAMKTRPLHTQYPANQPIPRNEARADYASIRHMEHSNSMHEYQRHNYPPSEKRNESSSILRQTDSKHNLLAWKTIPVLEEKRVNILTGEGTPHRHETVRSDGNTGSDRHLPQSRPKQNDQTSTTSP